MYTRIPSASTASVALDVVVNFNFFCLLQPLRVMIRQICNYTYTLKQISGSSCLIAQHMCCAMKTLTVQNRRPVPRINTR